MPLTSLVIRNSAFTFLMYGYVDVLNYASGSNSVEFRYTIVTVQ
jgi:hypothetical protein